ncbi:MAG: hypothetical protein IJT34_07110 [Butyrivibrio sp.]|nr:hypothetical protein [Butyrivibrio sp.]
MLKQKLRTIGDGILSFLRDESGMGTVEVILIIVVLIGLVIVFKQQIDGLVETIFKSIKEQAGHVTGT